MTTPEQQARDMLERMGIEHAPKLSAGDVVELGKFIERSDALLAELHAALDSLRSQADALSELKAELDAIKGAGEPVAWGVRANDGRLLRALVSTEAASQWRGGGGTLEPLYTRPCAPLTDEQIERGRSVVFSTNNPFCPCDSKTMRKAVRWAEAAHNIKGVKP